MLTLIVATALARGGDPDDPNHFYDVGPFGDDVQVRVTDAWARPDEAKLRLIVRNDTPDFVVIRTDQMLFSANAQAWAQDSVKVVDPRSTESKVLEFQGKDLKAHGGWFVPGGMYRIPTDGDPIAAPNFALPLRERGFDAGPFRCTVVDVDQETDATDVRFRCDYDGAGLGLIDPSAITVLVEGREFGNLEGNGRLEPVRPGDSFKLRAVFEVPKRVADMQFAELEIHFNDAFREGIPQAMPEWAPIQLEVDWKKSR